MSLSDKWVEFVSKMNEKGIPVPTARDPKTKEGSVSLSLVVVSAGLCSLAILMMLGIAISKFTGLFTVTQDSMNSLQNAFNASLQFFTACGALYFGRKFQKDDKKIEINEKSE